MNVKFKLTKLWVDLGASFVLFTKLVSTLILFIYSISHRLLALLKLDPLLFQTSIITNYTQNFESTQSNLNSCGPISHKN